MSQDPIGFDSGQLNLYEYAGDSPTGVTDPSGLDGIVVKGAYNTLLGQFPNEGEEIAKADYDQDVTLSKLTVQYKQTKDCAGNTVWVASTDNAQFRATVVNGKITVPKWINQPNGTTAEQRKNWDDFIKAVTTHEKGHLKVADDTAAAYNKNIGLKAASSSPQPAKLDAYKDLIKKLDSVKNDLLNGLIDAIDEAQDKYHETVGDDIEPADYLK